MVAFKAIARLLAGVAVIAAALTLVVAAALKVQDPVSFHDALAAHRVFPTVLLGVAPWLIIIAEAVAGLGAVWCIIAGRWRVAALSVTAVFLCFTIHTAALVIRPPTAPVGCGCGFGAAPVEDWAPIATRNALIAAALLVAAWRLTGPRAVRPETGPAMLRACCGARSGDDAC